MRQYLRLDLLIQLKTGRLQPGRIPGQRTFFCLQYGDALVLGTLFEKPFVNDLTLPLDLDHLCETRDARQQAKDQRCNDAFHSWHFVRTFALVVGSFFIASIAVRMAPFRASDATGNSSTTVWDAGTIFGTPNFATDSR